MDRRQFLKSVGCAGALMATSRIPIMAETSSDDDKTARKELGLTYATVHAGATSPFSILHISDTHLTEAYPHESETKQTLRRLQTQVFGGTQEEALRCSLAWAKENVDYVVHTGDLIDYQSEANFDLVKKYFGSEFICAVGNHEFSPDHWLSQPPEEATEEFKDRTRNLIEKVYPIDTHFQSQVVNGVNFITLDNVYSTVTPQQVGAFKKEIKKGLPIVLCMHVPFFSDEMWRVTRRRWDVRQDKKYRDAAIPPIEGEYKKQLDDRTTRNFIAMLRKEPLLKAILCGHVHINYQEPFSTTATQYMVGGNFQFLGQEILFT